MNITEPDPHADGKQLKELAQDIKTAAKNLGFQDCAITLPAPGPHVQRLRDWLDQKYHGEMQWMEERFALRAHPEQLHPALRVICVRMDYLTPDVATGEMLDDPERAYIARYALGRDYHKTLRARLSQLGQKMTDMAGEHGFRAFVDSAPILERALAENAGLGWIGKNTMLINKNAGSWFFLGELFTNLPLPVDQPTSHHCGSCNACIDICPTRAIIAPYVLDARKCISYLTIEYDGIIPEPLRAPMGNRIFGCDDCQIACPWNKFAQPTPEADFFPRHQLDVARLQSLLTWSEQDFLTHTEGSAMRRAGYRRFMRNVIIAAGNAKYDENIIRKLEDFSRSSDDLFAVHARWSLTQLKDSQA